MNRTSIKTAAEAVLRELPSVLGAYVSEDLEGHPREVHLLVGPGPDLAGLARDIRGLLQERLGIPVDQRVISIAQLARDLEADSVEGHDLDGPDVESPKSATPSGQAGSEWPAGSEGPAASERSANAVGSARAGAVAAHQEDAGDGSPPSEPRPVFDGIESTVGGGRVAVTVRLLWQGVSVDATGDAADTTPGRARAAATATLRAAMSVAASSGLVLELDFASVVQALDGDYVLVSVLGVSERIGRRPLPLVGAHPIESDVEGAAALASLKAINRVLALALQER
jgi:hypothetical protein